MPRNHPPRNRAERRAAAAARRAGGTDHTSLLVRAREAKAEFERKLAVCAGQPCPICGMGPVELGFVVVFPDGRLGEVHEACAKPAEDAGATFLLHKAFVPSDSRGDPWAADDRLFFQHYGDRFLRARDHYPGEPEAMIAAAEATDPEKAAVMAERRAVLSGILAIRVSDTLILTTPLYGPTPPDGWRACPEADLLAMMERAGIPMPRLAGDAALCGASLAAITRIKRWLEAQGRR